MTRYIARELLFHGVTGVLHEVGQEIDLSHLEADRVQLLRELGSIEVIEDAQPDETLTTVDGEVLTVVDEPETAETAAEQTEETPRKRKKQES